MPSGCCDCLGSGGGISIAVIPGFGRAGNPTFRPECAEVREALEDTDVRCFDILPKLRALPCVFVLR